MAIELFTCPKGISRGRLGSWLSALTLPLAWPGSKGFTAFFGLIVGVSVESGNVCRLSKVSLCLSFPPAAPGRPRRAPPRTQDPLLPPSHLSLSTRVPAHDPRPRTHGRAPLSPFCSAHTREPALTPADSRSARIPRLPKIPSRTRAPLGTPAHSDAHTPHLPCQLTCSHALRQTDRQTPRLANLPPPPTPPAPRTPPEPGPGLGEEEEGGRAPPASPPRSPALWTFVWLCG